MHPLETLTATPPAGPLVRCACRATRYFSKFAAPTESDSSSETDLSGPSAPDPRLGTKKEKSREAFEALAKNGTSRSRRAQTPFKFKVSAGSDLFASSTPNPHLWINVDLNPHAQATYNQQFKSINPHLWIKKTKSTSAARRLQAIAEFEVPAESMLRYPLKGSKQSDVPDSCPPNPHLWMNVDLNPHAQTTDNQPFKAKNPHLWIKNAKSTSPRPPPRTPSEFKFPTAMC